MKPLVLSDEAIGDIQGIGTYIAADRPDRALSFMDELEQKAMSVAASPLSFRERRDLSPELRAVRHGAYMIFFRDLPDQVRVVRVIHGARDLSTIFKS